MYAATCIFAVSCQNRERQNYPTTRTATLALTLTLPNLIPNPNPIPKSNL